MIDRHTLVLSSNWTGEIQDHSDLILELRREWQLLVIPVRYVCEALYQGTLVVLPNSQEVVMSGAKAGDYKVFNPATNFFGRSDPSVKIDSTESIARIHEAVFTYRNDA